MKGFYLSLAIALLTLPAWADDLKPEPLGQSIKEYNALSNPDVDPGNHEVWKLYIVGELYADNYNHEKEILVGSLIPGSSYIVYLNINQLYNFMQPIPKVGDVIAVEGRVIVHTNSVVEGPYKRSTIPMLYMYLSDASKLPAEPDMTAAILGTISKPTPVPTANSAPVSQASAPAMPVSTTVSQPLTFGLDVLRPEPMAQAIQEYHSFWSAKEIEPSNHVIWKVYLRKTLTAKDDPTHKPKDFSAVLTLVPKPSWVVRLDVQQLGQFIKPAPKLGDVIAIEGRITNRLIHLSQGEEKTTQVKTLIMDLQNAQRLPYEDVILPKTTEEEENDFVSAPAPSAAPVTATPGFFKATPGNQ